ncbi:TetR/AcrR family transcriptional regulator [Cohnella cellulosilytica]|uniref:TetR/AcrR family transcriptional regulator n=1 Tax=Cohnella cellulosilytica TaxID=986710 RepID=A0ABW2FET9_9BACL
MQDKKKLILEAAIRCFARKGFNATSIQEIVDELGMAKGSIYFYFKSKDDLLVSVIDYYGEMLYLEMREHPGETILPPREKFAIQLERQYRFVHQHLDFMKMLLKEPFTGLHPQIQQMIIRLRARSQLWNASHLMAIYGETATLYLADACALVSGMWSQYFEALLFGELVFDGRQLSRFITRRLDDLVNGMLRSEETPLLPPLDLVKLRCLAGVTEEDLTEELRLLAAIKSRIVSCEFSEVLRRDLNEALALLKEMIEMPSAGHRLLARGMLALLKQNGPSDLAETIDRLDGLIGSMEA